MTADWWLRIFAVSSCVGISLTVVSIFGILHYSSRVEGRKSRMVNDLMQTKGELQRENADLKAKMKIYQDGRTKDETSSASSKTAPPAPATGPASSAENLGVITTYDFNGVKKVISKSGKESLYAGPEVTVFRTIRKLEKEQKLEELTKVCEEQIYKTPEWLTPHLFLGLAYANAGKHEMAMRKFEFVLENAPNDPVYAQAGEFLKMLKEETGGNLSSRD